MRSVLLLVLLGFLFPACSGPDLKKREQSLHRAAEVYNEKLRWQKYGAASSYVRKELKSQFLQKQESLRDNYQITEVRVVSADLDGEEPIKGTTQVYVTYFMLPNASLRKQLYEQNWTYDEEKETWFIDLTDKDLEITQK